MSPKSAPVPSAPPKFSAARKAGDVWRSIRALGWPPAVASLLFLAWMGWFIRADRAANGGHLIYPLDDAYAHMAIAKHLVRNGVWGFSVRGGFSWGGSSVLWPILIAAWYAVTGVNDYAPLALNLIAVVATLFYAAGMIRRYTPSHALNLGILAALVVLTPLPSLSLEGMEHTWQIFIDLMFVDLASRVLADGEPPESVGTARRWLPVASALLTSVRYEGFFLLGMVGLLLLCRRRWRQAVVIGVAGALPITVAGLYAMGKGWFFLPNSLMLKGTVPSVTSWNGLWSIMARVYGIAANNSHLAIMLLAMAAALLGIISRRRTVWTRPAVLLIVTMGGLVQHLELAFAGWYYRYEAYLMALGIVSVCAAVLDGFPTAGPAPRRTGGWWAYVASVSCAAVVFGTPLCVRAVGSFHLILQAAHNVYEQHFFMAQFVHDFYRDKAVAANDIGAIDYFGNIDLVDIWGLGSMEVARAKRAGNLGEDVIRPLFARHDVRLFVGYDDWSSDYGGQLPEWVPVGRWTIPNNVVCGSATLSFYAAKLEYAPQLARDLQKFAPRLPRDVVQAGLYVGDPLPHLLGAYLTTHGDDGRPTHWTNHRATFYLTPLGGPAPPPAATATLLLPLWPVNKITGLDVILNGQTVGSRKFTSREVGQLLPWQIKVRWISGYNQLCLVAHGQAETFGEGHNPALFAVGEPVWTFDPPPTGPVAP